jgi:hypothetical protein
MRIRPQGRAIGRDCDPLIMPIPTDFDRKLGAIDDAHSLILIKLRTMQYGGAPRDARAELRVALQDYADQVMVAATEDA